TQTRICVRIPAALPRHSRSRPISPPSNTASSSANPLPLSAIGSNTCPKKTLVVSISTPLCKSPGTNSASSRLVTVRNCHPSFDGCQHARVPFGCLRGGRAAQEIQRHGGGVERQYLFL